MKEKVNKIKGGIGKTLYREICQKINVPWKRETYTNKNLTSFNVKRLDTMDFKIKNLKQNKTKRYSCTVRLRVSESKYQ